MARNDKPVKIKRYKNTMGGKTQSVAAAKRFIPFIAAGVLLIVLGFVLGKPVINFITGRGGSTQVEGSLPGDTHRGEELQPAAKPTKAPKPTKQPEATPQPQEILPTQQPATPPVQVAANSVYYYVNASALTTEAGIDNVISQMKSKGATHLVFDAKNRDGNVHYNSQNEYASQLKSDVQIDVGLLTNKLKSNGLTAVARVYTFMDKMISTVERSTAVMYRGTETRWLDTSAALGGKAWANPASKIMQDYIIALTDELLALGVSDIIYAGFSTPTGYSLDKRDFGASQQQVLANMKNLIVTLQAKISAKGGMGIWQFEYSAITPEGSYAHYIVHPYQLGAENIILTAKGSDTDRAAVDSVKNSLTQEEISSISLWFTDNTNTEITHPLGSYFVY